MERLVIQKNCEVLDLVSDPKEKNTYDVQVLLTKEMEEFAPVPLKLKGSSEEMVKILQFLGDAFQNRPDLENQLDKLSIAPITFELKGKNIVAKDVRGNELLDETLPDVLTPADKVNELSEKFFKIR
jgi:hypothetical protein